MRNEITENKEFYIISRRIDNAQICRVIEVCEDCFKVKLNNKAKYEVDESVELFAMTSLGQLYFETIVKEINDDNTISIWFPMSSKYLQRREYSRIPTDMDVILEDDTNTVNAKVFDISAGGLKLTTNKQLVLLKEYKILLSVENKEIKTEFQPIRMEAFEEKFVISGRFKQISNYDRISLVQYCFRKQIENSTI